MNRSISVVLLLFSFITACGQKSYEEKLSGMYKYTVPLINPDTLKSELESKDIILIDTRSMKEYKVSHLPNARFLDYDRYSKKDFKDIPKDAEVVVYCSVGYRSERVGEKMKSLGFTNVKNLYGGIFEWKNTDNQVVNDKGVSTDSVHTYNKNWSQWLEKGIKVYE
ncbi:MAG: rhodanese-like domain-containing protein [Cyclobacteriaceae bacterium]